MSYNEITKEEWMMRLAQFPLKHTDMNRLVMNYLVTEGFKEAAEKFQIEAGLTPTIELNSLDDRILIREAVQDGRIDEAIHLVNELHPNLLDNDRYLLFHMQQMQLIELIRTGNVEEALTFAQTKLAEASEDMPEVLGELERTLALLAFEKPEKSPFANLLEQSNRQKIASELNAAILRSERCTDSTPKVLYLLKLIVWSQTILDTSDVKYPKMKDMATATIEFK